MSMNGGFTNARPGGDYQAPMMPTSNRFSGDVIRPEKWDEVLQHLQTVLQENAKLNEALQENNEQVESIIRQKDEEIKAAQKLHWDVRISVLGFKSKIMILTSEIEKLRENNREDGDSAEINELKIKIRELEGEKKNTEVSVSELRDDLSSLQSKITNLQSANKRATNHYEQTQESLLRNIAQLEEELKKKSNSPPQPKPRTNIQPRQDGKLAQVERERDQCLSELEKYRKIANEERTSRQQAEQLRVEIENNLNRTRFEKTQLEGKIRNQEMRINQLSKEKQVGPSETSIAVGVGGSAARRMLNTALDDKNKLTTEVMQLKETMQDVEHQVLEKSRQYEEAMREIMIQRETIKGQSTNNEELTQQLSDVNYSLNQKIANLEDQDKRTKDQLQNLNEKYHEMQVQYSKAVNQLKSKEKQAEEEDWDQLSHMEELMDTVEKKNTQIQELQQLLTQYSNAENERNRLMERLKHKEADCKSYLDQMETWKIQYETAQSDFAQERAVREKEAIAVKTLKENRDALQKEIGELRKRVTDDRIIIANLQSQSSSGYPHESYTKLFPATGLQGENVSPPMGGGTGSRRSHDTSQPYKDEFITPGQRSEFHASHLPDPEPSYRRDDHGVGGMGHRPTSDQGLNQKSFDESNFRVPDPHLGVMPPPDPPNQLNNPQPPITPRALLGGGGGNPQLPPANAFPQFAGQQQERPRGGWGGDPAGGFNLPGEVQKMEAPVIDNCPICGRNGFRTQTDLEVHAAKCG